MNALTKNLLLLLLLSSAFIFPACGSKEVKSDNASETVLKSSEPALPPMVATPTIEVTPTPTVPSGVSMYVNTYVKKSSTHKRVASAHKKTKKSLLSAPASIPMMAAPLVTPVPTISMPIETFTPVTISKKKTGSRWPLILAILALLAALGFYFWSKKAPPHNDFPLPPMGGLSPVSGFTAMRKKIQPETKKQSIWKKKIL